MKYPTLKARIMTGRCRCWFKWQWHYQLTVKNWNVRMKKEKTEHSSGLSKALPNIILIADKNPESYNWDRRANNKTTTRKRSTINLGFDLPIQIKAYNALKLTSCKKTCIFNLAKFKSHFTHYSGFLPVQKLNICFFIFTKKTQWGRAALLGWGLLPHKVCQLFDTSSFIWFWFPFSISHNSNLSKSGSDHHCPVSQTTVFTNKEKSFLFYKQKLTLYPAQIWRTDNFCLHSRCPTILPCTAVKRKGSSLTFSSLLATTLQPKKKQNEF